jgi:hypothetical protein
MAQGYLGPRGGLAARKIRRQAAPLIWRVRNALRWAFLKGHIAAHLIVPFANWWGVATIIGRLEAVLIKASGERVYFGTLGHRVVTDAGVAFLVDDWDVNTASATNDITTLKYHGCGTGTTAEAASQTALVTESTTALNPDSTRATGTQSQPSANILQSVGTLTFDATAAVTEHGLFSQAATGGGTLWDRTVFSAINVVSGDSIQFTYSLTCSAGG